MNTRVKVELRPTEEIGACILCDDRPAPPLTYNIIPTSRGLPLRFCEPCMIAMFSASSVASREGTPLDKGAMKSWPLRAPGENGEVRHAVVMIIYPPVELRDASRDVIDLYVQTKKKGILAGIVEEIHRSYVSEPTDGSAARNIAEALVRHADTLREG